MRELLPCVAGFPISNITFVYPCGNSQLILCALSPLQTDDVEGWGTNEIEAFYDAVSKVKGVNDVSKTE